MPSPFGAAPKKLKASEFKLISVGTDTELFLVKKGTTVPVPCINIMGGTKEKPIQMAGLPAGFAVQEDNVMLEFNVPPADSADMFSANLVRALSYIKCNLAERDLEPVHRASMEFTAEQLEHPQAQTFGCDPDFDVWERSVNEVCVDKSTLLRTAGGHIHVGFEFEGRTPVFPDDISAIEAVVQTLDIYLGVPFSLKDPDKKRMKLYGKAGAFRVKPYGLEYRVLSNFWTQSPLLTHYVYTSIERAFQNLNAHTLMGSLPNLSANQQSICSAINDGNAESAKRIMRNYGVNLPPTYGKKIAEGVTLYGEAA